MLRKSMYWSIWLWLLLIDPITGFSIDAYIIENIK
jgi:hypothetical protein